MTGPLSFSIALTAVLGLLLGAGVVLLGPASWTPSRNETAAHRLRGEGQRLSRPT